MLETFSQIMIGGLGGIAIWLIARKNKWGFVVGLASEPFWMLSTWRAGQWAIFLLAIFYTWQYIVGIRVYFREAK